jgi:hypothetical protein
VGTFLFYIHLIKYKLHGFNLYKLLGTTAHYKVRTTASFSAFHCAQQLHIHRVMFVKHMYDHDTKPLILHLLYLILFIMSLVWVYDFNSECVHDDSCNEKTNKTDEVFHIYTQQTKTHRSGADPAFCIV